MDTLASFEDLAVRVQTGNLTPEKLATLRRVFDAICEEFKIPLSAKSERNDLAYKILTAAGAMEYEPLLLIFARNAVAKYRR